MCPRTSSCLWKSDCRRGSSSRRRAQEGLRPKQAPRSEEPFLPVGRAETIESHRAICPGRMNEPPVAKRYAHVRGPRGNRREKNQVTGADLGAAYLLAHREQFRDSSRDLHTVCAVHIPDESAAIESTLRSVAAKTVGHTLKPERGGDERIGTERRRRRSEGWSKRDRRAHSGEGRRPSGRRCRRASRRPGRTERDDDESALKARDTHESSIGTPGAKLDLNFA